MEEIKNPYLEALNLFVSQDEYRSWMNKPFIVNDLAIATDAHALISCSSMLAPGVGPLEDYDQNNVLQVMAFYPNVEYIINVSELEEALAKCPMVPEMAECESCSGEGEVEFEYFYKGRSYTTDDDCPICDGNGEIRSKSGKKEVDTSALVKVKNSYFSTKYIAKMAALSTLFNSSTVTLIHQTTPLLHSVFQVDKMNLLIMPMRFEKGEDDKVIHVID